MKIVIVGAGKVGFHIASRLALENKDVVVIDSNPEALIRLSESIDVQTIVGSGSSPATLEAAGIRDAEIILAVTDSDEVNLVACLMADTLYPTTKKLARLRGADFDRYHDTFKENAPHIDTVINPDIEVVRTIERLMSVPGAVDVGEFADGRIKFVGVYLEPGSHLAGMRLADLPGILKEDRPLIAAIVRDDQLIIPKGDNHLRDGDLVYFISEEKNLFKHLSIFDKHATPIKRVLIVGIEQVVSPRLSAINTILQHIRRGKVLSAISIKGEAGEVMEALALPTSGIVSKPLKKIAFPKGSMVAGIIRRETIIIPGGDSIIEPDDRIIIFATREAIPGVEKILAVKLEYI